MKLVRITAGVNDRSRYLRGQVAMVSSGCEALGFSHMCRHRHREEERAQQCADRLAAKLAAAAGLGAFSRTG